jgi:disulfide bond formation protein DsbB
VSVGVSARTLLATIAAASLASVALALVSQHVFDMQPCPWCILQRVIFLAIAAVALVALAWPVRAVHLSAAWLIAVLAACGIAAGMWQHFVAAKSQSCDLTLADRIVSGLGLDRGWPDVFAVRASCFDAAADLLGVPFEFWSAAMYAVLGSVALALLLRKAYVAPPRTRH